MRNEKPMIPSQPRPGTHGGHCELGLINDNWDTVPRHSATLPFFKAL
jgi:hypothetical protein